MDGEFDREINDDGWGPVTRAWRPLEEQLNDLLAVATVAVQGKKKEKKLAEIKGRVEGLIKQKGRKLSDPGPLGAWFCEKKQEYAVRQKEAEEKAKQAGILKRGKWAKEGQALKEEHRGWSELAIWWQSAKHLHTTDKEQPRQVQKVKPTPHTHDPPPPYTPPSAPTADGMYPTLQVTQGMLQIESGNKDCEIESVDSIEYAEMEDVPGWKEITIRDLIPGREGRSPEGKSKYALHSQTKLIERLLGLCETRKDNTKKREKY